MKKKILNIIILLLGCLLIALTYNIFCVPKNYVTGGVSGLGIIFNHLFGFSTSNVLMIGNVFVILLGIISLGYKKIIPSIIGSIIFTLCVYLTEGIQTISFSSVFLDVVVIGVLYGIGCTMVYLAGYTSGGTDVLALILNRKFGTSMGTSLLVINGVILALGTVVFGIEMLVVALISRYIESKIIDYFLIGISDSKVLFINTKKIEEVNDYIIKEIESGISEIKITNGFKKTSGKVIMCVVPTEKYLFLKEKIIEIDKDAFITIIDAYEVYGGTNRYKLPLHDLRI